MYIYFHDDIFGQKIKFKFHSGLKDFDILNTDLYVYIYNKYST